MKLRYNIGDCVVTRPGSDHDYQSEGNKGRIVAFRGEVSIFQDLTSKLSPDEYYYRVKWDVIERTDSYRPSDLMPVYGEDSDLSSVKYKVGDWVKILSNYSGSTHKIGDVILVHSLSAAGEARSVEINALHGPGNGWIASSQLRRATDSEIADAKASLVGRYIKCKRDFPNGRSVRKDEVGLIDHCYSGCADITGFTQAKYSADLNFSTNYELLPKEYVPKSSTSMTETINEGDYVIITKSSQNWNQDMNKFVGRVVQVVSSTKTGSNNYSINFVDDGWYYWSSVEKHFRKATDVEIAESKNVKKVTKSSDTTISDDTMEKFGHLEPYRLNPGDFNYEDAKRDLFSAIAKRKYPPGTVYKCTNSGCMYTVEDRSVNTYRILQGSGSVDAGSGMGYFMENGKWATIVEESPISKKDPIKDLGEESLNLSISSKKSTVLSVSAVKSVPTISVKISK